jgi:glutathione synthase/RimK-type ligase-like ATP-grasp enzyme
MNKSSPIVAVYFTNPNPLGPPLDDEEYHTAYHQFGERITKKGGRFVLVRSLKNHVAANRFLRGQVYQNGTFVEWNEPLTVDVLFNKGEDFPVTEHGPWLVNDPALYELCTSKNNTYARFAQFAPKSVFVTTMDEYVRAINDMPTHTVVCKPVDGACGRGIKIATKKELLADTLELPTIIQEFVDTSGGIDGIVEGTHDLRIVIIGGELAYAEFRTPAPGTLLCNVSLGGSFAFIPLSSIPEEAMQVVRAIDADLAEFPERVYSIDLGRAKSGEWKLIELNAPSGLLAKRGDDPSMERYHELLAELLLRVARNA